MKIVKWEYEYESWNTKDFLNRLNYMGSFGWELITITHIKESLMTPQTLMLFKRPK